MGFGAGQNEGTNPIFVDSIGVVNWLWLCDAGFAGVTWGRTEGRVWRELPREAGVASAECEHGPGGTVMTHVCGEGR